MRRRHADSGESDEEDPDAGIPAQKRSCTLAIPASQSTDLLPLLSTPEAQLHHAGISTLISLFATLTGWDQHATCQDTSQRMSREMLYGHRLNEFWEALGLDAQDIMTLVVAWRWHCSTNGVIYRIEFIRGMLSMGCTTIVELQKHLRDLRHHMETTPTTGKHGDTFKELYLWVFQFYKQQQLANRRTIDVQLAIQLLRMLLSDRFPKHVASFVQYLQRHVLVTTPGFRMTQDQWSSYYEFCHTVQPHTLIAYDPEGSWPVLIDEYVEWLQQHQRPASGPTNTPAASSPHPSSPPRLLQTNFYATASTSSPHTQTSSLSAESRDITTASPVEIESDPGSDNSTSHRPRRTRSALQHVRIECEDDNGDDIGEEMTAREMSTLMEQMNGYHMNMNNVNMNMISKDGDGDLALDTRRARTHEEEQKQAPTWKMAPINTTVNKQYKSLSPTPSPQSLSTVSTPPHGYSRTPTPTMSSTSISTHTFPTMSSTSSSVSLNPFTSPITLSPSSNITSSLTHLLRIASTSSNPSPSSRAPSSCTTPSSILPFHSPIPSTLSVTAFQSTANNGMEDV